MTCIVGLIHDGIVYMGADSAGVRGSDITTRKDRKVFFVENEEERFLLGFTTSFRMGQLLHYKFHPPLRNQQDLDHYMRTEFVDTVRSTFKEGGYAKKDAEREVGGEFLIGTNGRLFQMHWDYQVGEMAYHFDAAGSGASIALGVLFATMDLSLPPRKRVELALQAAEEFTTGVRGPFSIESF